MEGLPLQGKLVRDCIPDRIRADGAVPRIRIATDAERGALLTAKLLEEAAEAAVALPDTLAEELADVLEVVRAIAKHAGIQLEALLLLQDCKRLEKGAFENGIILEGIDPSA